MKRLVVFFLLITLVLTSFAACKTNNNGSNDVSNQTSTDTSGDVSGETRYTADVPYTDNNGRKVKILTTATSATPKFTEFGFDTGEEVGESVINTAIEERNNKVEELLGIEIVEELVVDGNRFVGGKLRDRVLQAMNSLSDDFLLVVPSLYNCGALASEGALYDLNSFQYLHKLSAPWWDQNFISDLAIDGKMFFITGDIGIEQRNSLTVCFFNKNMFEELELGDPYQLVRDKKWTFEKLIELSRKVKLDLNDDNIIDYQDKFGLGGQNDLAWAMFYGSGERIASKGSDGYPQLSMYNTRSTGVMEKMLELVTNDDYFVNANNYFGISNTPTELIIEAFISSRALLFCEGLGAVDKLREMAVDTDFGILPIPLYNEDQTEYQHMVNPWSGNAMAIPRYLQSADAEFASIVMEVIGAESKNYITPAYYERALKRQVVRDEESAEMLDIIFSGVGADMGHIYNWGELGRYVLHESVTKKLTGQFQSQYEKYQGAAQAALEKTVEAFKELEN